MFYFYIYNKKYSRSNNNNTPKINYYKSYFL